MDPTVNTVNSLLAHLNIFIPSLPKSSTTLNQSTGKIDVKTLCGGHYYYLSVRNAIDRYLCEYPNASSIELIVCEY